MEQAAHVKRHPVWWDSLEKRQVLFARIFLIRWNRVSPHSPSSASSAGLLLGQPVLGLHIFRNLKEKKRKMAPVNMSKIGPIIFVNS